jgi:hypothetical protein
MLVGKPEGKETVVAYLWRERARLVEGSCTRQWDELTSYKEWKLNITRRRTGRGWRQASGSLPDNMDQTSVAGRPAWRHSQTPAAIGVDLLTLLQKPPTLDKTSLGDWSRDAKRTAHLWSCTSTPHFTCSTLNCNKKEQGVEGRTHCTDWLSYSRTVM